MKHVRVSKDGRYFFMSAQVIDSAFFGLLLLVKPHSAQSEVFGRKAHWLFRWQVKS